MFEHKQFVQKYSFIVILLIISFGLFGCNTSSSDHNSSKILIIAGSTTILPVSEMWAKGFYENNKIQVNVQGGGSTNGIQLAAKGHISLGASSRDLNEQEKKGLDIIELGKDALAVIVHPDNNLQNVSTDTLQKIYTGQITNWKELGGEDARIQLINRESGSGTRDCFEHVVICSEDADKAKCPHMSLSAIVLNSNAEVKKSVELIKHSIGYVSYGFVDSTVKALKINAKELTLDNIYNHSYELSRSLLYLKNTNDDSKELKDFLEYIKTPSAQQVLIKEGFIPLYKAE